MKITSSYAARVMGDKNITAQIANTVSVYREAVMYLIDVVKAEGESVGPVYKAKKNERKKQGHRQPYTLVKITAIGAAAAKKTAAKKTAAKKAEAETEAKAE